MGAAAPGKAGRTVRVTAVQQKGRSMIGAVAKRILPPAVQSYLRGVRLRRSITRFRPATVSRRFGRVQLQVALKDPLAAEWYDHNWAEPAEIGFLRGHSLRPGATVFDLGAHQCVVALMLADAVGPEGRVVALEANSHNAAVAKENAALNGAANLLVLHAAAAAAPGELTFNESLNGQVDGGAATHGQVTVPARSVDGLAAEHGHPDLVFVDVEGFECEVLSGAAATLSAGADCFVEVHGGCGLEKFGGSVSRLLGFFPPDRFDLFHAGSDQEPFRPLDAAALAAGAARPGARWFLIALHRKAA